MSLNRLERGSRLETPGGREQLQETLDLFSSTIRSLREELTLVREQDKIVAPVPIDAYPLAIGRITTGSDLPVGTIVQEAADLSGSVPPNYLRCDGTAVSRSTYSTLFGIIGITWGPGDGATTFNLPDLRRRVLVGDGGSGTGTLGSTVGSTGGEETHTLTTTELASHSHGITDSGHTHDLGNHTHSTPAHSHSMNSHLHTYTFYTVGGGITVGPAWGASGGSPQTATGTGPSPSSTATDGSGTSGTPSSNTSGSNTTGISTNNAGSGGAHNNMQPSAVAYMMIKVAGGPEDTSQKVPLAWGPVPAVWDLGLQASVPYASVTNSVVSITGSVPEPVVRMTSGPGTKSGTVTITVTGLTRVPYNFRKFKTRGVSIRTKVTLTGCAAATVVVATLKVSNPIATSGYLGATYTRTLAVAAGTIADSDYVEAKLGAEDLGTDWKPGYLLRFELSFQMPRTYTAATIDVGALRIDW